MHYTNFIHQILMDFTDLYFTG